MLLLSTSEYSSTLNEWMDGWMGCCLVVFVAIHGSRYGGDGGWRG